LTKKEVSKEVILVKVGATVDPKKYYNAEKK